MLKNEETRLPVSNLDGTVRSGTRRPRAEPSVKTEVGVRELLAEKGSVGSTVGKITRVIVL